MEEWNNQSNNTYTPYNGAYYEQSTDTLSAKNYNLIIGGCLFWGFFINYLLCKYAAPALLGVSMTALLIGYFILAFAGMMIVNKTESPVIAFVGYNMICLPVGAVLSVCLYFYDPFIVQYAFLATTLITVIMSVLSFIYPNAFLSLGKALFFSLLAVLVAEILMTFVFRMNVGAIDYIVALIFSLYIGYDLAKAQKKQFTVQSAIASAAELYMDIINLFLRILSILGRNRD